MSLFSHILLSFLKRKKKTCLEITITLHLVLLRTVPNLHETWCLHHWCPSRQKKVPLLGYGEKHSTGPTLLGACYFVSDICHVT
jgi:hypothetical protein